MMKNLFYGISPFHGRQYLGTRKFVPFSSYNDRMRVMLSYHFYGRIKFFLTHSVSMAQDDRAGMFYLIIEEFPKVLHIKLRFSCVYYSSESVKLYFSYMEISHRVDYVAELSYSGGLYQYPLRRKVFYDLPEGLSEVSHQAAAYAA